MAADRALALQVADTIDAEVRPLLAEGTGSPAMLDDTSPDHCDGGDARLDLYLVHGINARGLTVPIMAPGVRPSAVFALINADLADDATQAAVQQVADAVQTSQQAAVLAPGSERRRATASRAAPSAAVVTAAALAAPAAPTVLQAKGSSLVSGTTTLTLNNPVTAGNWIAVALSTFGTTPRNVLLSDNWAHSDLSFGATASRYSSSFGTIWRYVKVGTTGTYTLSANRAGATSGTVQVFEVGGADASTFLDTSSLSASGNSRTASGTFGSATTRTNDLLLSLVAVNSGTATITPGAPTGSAAVSQVQNSSATARVMSYPTTTTGAYRVSASLASSAAWRLSSIAIAGAAAPPVVTAPVNTALPAISVTDKLSYLTLTASHGTWSNTPTSYAYTWTRNGTAVGGATLPSYDTTVADQGTSVAVRVTASNAAGSASATSAAVPVPVPGTPTAPALAFTASPPNITQGQPTTLAWSSTNATSCTASGAWSGSKAVSGSAVVTPATSSSYTLACSGAGGTATATVAINVTAAPPGSNPTLGAHAMVYHRSQGSVGPFLSTPALTTQSGSTLLAFVGKGSIWNLSPPIDNKGNTPYVQIGAIHEYTKWPGEGTTFYAFNSIAGGADHILSVDDTNVWDEVTFAAVEIKNGGLIQDYKWNEVLGSAAQTSQSVTTTGPATLVAVWYGDDASSTPSNPVPNDGFTVIEGNGNATESVQMYVATKDVPAAGTYTVTWNTTPLQGAQLYLIAVQKRP